MSWIDDIENISLTIITGDGKSWEPKWKNASKEVEYNASVFEFVNVEGSLVLRQKPKGRKFELELYFDGENAVTIGNSFEQSARDSRIWTIKHPFYGDFKCQPLNLKQDNSGLNVSKFSITVIETITDAYPKPSVVFVDEIESQLVITNEAQAQAFNNSKELEKVSLQNNVETLDTYLSKIIKTGEELKEFKTAVSDAVIEITNVTSSGLTILRAIQSIINYPATIEQTIEARFTALKEAFNTIIDTFTGNKNQFEAVAGGLVAAMYVASSTNITDDYDTRVLVFNQQDKLSEVYNEYVTYLDSLQTDRADSDDSYIPSFDGLNELNKLAGLTMSNLYDIAFSAKQEREYTLDKDSNPILLTHKFYGLDKKDVNLSKFIKTNNIGLNELLNIVKGRKIIYYV
jgi:hypothetical protein